MTSPEARALPGSKQLYAHTPHHSSATESLPGWPQLPISGLCTPSLSCIPGLTHCAMFGMACMVCNKQSYMQLQPQLPVPGHRARTLSFGALSPVVKKNASHLLTTCIIRALVGKGDARTQSSTYCTTTEAAGTPNTTAHAAMVQPWLHTRQLHVHPMACVKRHSTGITIINTGGLEHTWALPNTSVVVHANEQAC